VVQDEINYIIGFSFFEGIGPLRYRLLVQYFGSPAQAYSAASSELITVGLSPQLVAKFCQFRERTDLTTLVSSIRKKDIDIVVEGDARFPTQLAQTKGYPFILYVLGDAGLLQHAHTLGVVGTRKPTPYGLDITRQLSTSLAEAGCCIVSGMAMGVDTVAHQAALDAGGKTIAVLGCGVDICYPRINFRLYQSIITHGLVLSEFPPGMGTSRGVFPSRNRIVAGLSQAVIVTEGAEKSGSLITAKYAADYGRDVYAVPGPVTSSLSFASNFLLKNGAKIVTTVADILDDFDLKPVPQVIQQMELSREERKIVDLIKSRDTMHIDEIARMLTVPFSHVSILISTLMIKGVVGERQNGEYTIRS
jgi:DNA processing protein